ncbi:MAG: MBG domain-containing protein [Minisyncoccia bacterium]
MKNALRVSLPVLLSVLVFGISVPSALADAPTVVLGVTQIIAVQTYATAGRGYDKGWKWVFDVTVPKDQTILQMEFDDWTSALGYIPADGNIQFYSAQSLNATDEDQAIGITASSTLSSPMYLNPNEDLDMHQGGRQIQITVEAQVPEGAAGGSYSTSYGITTNPPASQTVSFGPLSDKTFGDAPFGLTATSTSGLLPIIFSVVSGPVTINDSTTTITGVGAVTLEASQAGSPDFYPASTTASFTVKAPLTITASDGTMTYGGTPPTITPTYLGFVNGDTDASLTTQPTCSVSGTVSSCTGAVDSNYTIAYVNGTVTVAQAASVTTVSCPASPQPYTGLALTPCTASYSTSDGQSGQLTPTYTGNVDVGTATANATYDGDSNHAGSSNSATFDIVVNIPIITLNGSGNTGNPTYIVVGGTYTELGAVATDIVDGTDLVTIGGDVVNPSISGTYHVTYDSVDAAGNHAIEVIRTVIVIEANQNITISDSNGGSISAVTPTFSSPTYEITADQNYYISDVLVDGQSVVGQTGFAWITGNTDASYTFTNVTTHHILSAVFDPIPLTTLTVAARDVTSTGATLNGINGNAIASEYSFWVSTSTFSTGSSVPPTGVYNDGDISGPIDANASFSAPLSSVSGLSVTPKTTYYFAAWSYVNGTWYPGTVLNFTTPAVTPAWNSSVGLTNGTAAGSGPALTAALTVTGDTSIQFSSTATDPFNVTLTSSAKISFMLTSTGGVDLSAYYKANQLADSANLNSTWGQHLINTLPGATTQTAMFYITYDGTNYKIQDGTQDSVGNPSPMFIPANFPAGTYTLTGNVNGTSVTVALTITNTNGWAAPLAISSITLNGSGLPPSITSVGSGVNWTITVPQDMSTTPPAYYMTSATVDITGANSSITSYPVTINGTGMSTSATYGNLVYDATNNVWTLTPSIYSEQTFETAGTWVLTAPVEDATGAVTNLNVTLTVS